MSLRFTRVSLFIVLSLPLFIIHALCINCSCSLSATSVNFGNSYNPLSGNVNNTSGTVAVTCTSPTPIINASFTLTLSTGNNGNFNQRTLTSGNNRLAYNLFTSGNYAQTWGDGTGGTSTMSFAACSSTQDLPPYSCSYNFIIFGKIPGSQTNVIAGTLTDTITATLDY